MRAIPLTLGLGIALALCSLPSLAAGDDFPGVRALMSPEQYEAAGLDKLSPEELEALDQWLVSYTAGEAEILRDTSEEVKEAEAAFEITTSIKQPFRGWDGDTVFYLENGQVWRQRVKGRYNYSGSDTRVMIYRNFMGLHVLKLVDAGVSIGVSRVR